MPKLRETRPDFDAMGRLLRGYGANGAQLSIAIGCARETALRKLDDPSRLTLGDLARASKAFGIPMDEIRAAVKK